MIPGCSSGGRRLGSALPHLLSPQKDSAVSLQKSSASQLAS